VKNFIQNVFGDISHAAESAEMTLPDYWLWHNFVQRIRIATENPANQS